MEEKNQVSLLYEKFLNHQCTDAEMEQLFLYFQTSSEEELAQLVREALEVEDNAIDPTDEERIKLSQIYDTLKNNIQPENTAPFQIPFYKRSFYRISAAAAVLIFVFAGVWFYIHKSEHANMRVAKNQFEADIAPGGNKAFLTLANGTKLSLTDADDGEISQEAGVTINKAEDGQLVYTVVGSDPKKGESPQFNVIETPRGGQYQISLPDGTKIWLNASSSLRYPTAFTGKERKVELTGEAYFEVAENKSMPFKVVSKDQIVEVLGTHFNVNAYPEEGAIKTTLLEGSVNVRIGDHSAVLKPGQQALVDQSVQVKIADLQESIAWKNGRTQFSNANIHSIMRMLSRWYDIEVDYQGEIINTGFGGSVSRSKNISEILKLLELTGDVHFKIEGRRVIVMP